MKSSWASEVLAILRKELRSEMRSKSATFTALMLSVTTVFTLAFAYYGRTIGGEDAAGMLWAGLLFAGIGTLARVFVYEDEQGTGDLLRVWANPYAVFWGKAVFAFFQMTLTTALVSIMFLVLTGVPVRDPTLLVLSLGGTSAALAGSVTLASAIISKGANRGNLAGVIALPILLPLLALGVAAGTAALLGGRKLDAGYAAMGGTWLYTVLVLAIAPHLFVAIWREQ